MSVVHPGAQHRIAALQQRADGHLRARREVAHRAQVALTRETGWGGWAWGQDVPKICGEIVSWRYDGSSLMMEIHLDVVRMWGVFRGLRTYMGYNTLSENTLQRSSLRCLSIPPFLHGHGDQHNPLRNWSSKWANGHPNWGSL